MKVTCEPTPEMHVFVINGVDVPSRIWKGTTDKGTRIELIVLSIVPAGDYSLDDEVPSFMRRSRDVFSIGKRNAD